MIEARLVELETTVAFQDDALNQLNGVVTRQQQELAELRRELTALRERWQALQASLAVAPQPDPPPPHY